MTERIDDRDPDAILADYEELTIQNRVAPIDAAKRLGTTLEDVGRWYEARKRREQRRRKRLERAAGGRPTYEDPEDEL